MTETRLPTHAGAVFGRYAAGVLARLLYRVRVVGGENVPRSGPVILAPNHTGFLDAPLLMGTCPRPVHTLAKKELFKGPLGWLLHGVGQIPLDRDDPSRGMIKAGTGVLDAGRILVVFPEGTRGAGDFSELRTGLAWFALRSGAPVVPVVFTGTAARGRTFGAMPGLRSRVEVVFGRPVTLPTGGGRTRSALDAATEQLREALVAHREAVASRIEERK
ncbi:lysophospholipid acyltransferase family protein [Jiangella rhizosphaerae]|uniref:1-acyl-sn-glycerol-3-phosphate acyltransferase n=1 Tax=Jiangella rhizosphaerae TaxID=2293569 RepID=A0A418KGU6_9ACTN|nr:lysophospholipid acyltransferase family protein [Jiangella rhizosphaerae]RIQ11264.1 1-acyl-sn-glycerol-3-phosphate acyltransferase [Jiangella rhizosphaerae]